MGYTIGTRWTNDLIEEKINDVKLALGIERMPTSVEIIKVMNDSSLTNAIRRHGGYKYWANKLNLKQSKCETRTGLKEELNIKELLERKGYKVEKMSSRHPYDLLVNNNIKIDVKASNKYKSDKGWSSYSFNLEKNNPACDIYIIRCIQDDKTLVIPSKYLRQSQLCITDKESKYDIYKDKWDYLDKFDKFYKSI